MNERVRRQQLRFMLYNLVAFTLIFTLFGLILYSQIRAYLFQPVEQTLYSARENIKKSPNYIDRQLSFQSFEPEEQPPDTPLQQPAGDPPPASDNAAPGKKQEEGDHRSFRRGPMETAMRVQSIIRDSEGEALNPQALGQIYFEGFLEEIPVPGEADLEKILAFSIDGAGYHSLSFLLGTPDGGAYTVQLITNVEGEQAILSNFMHLLVLCVIVFVLLSLLASYLLSKKTMTPIIRSWDRQTEFVENASHELRTPLTIIQNKLEAMLVEPRATVMEKAGDIGVSLAETRRLSKLTADLMTLARADSSSTQLEKERFPLDGLIRTVCEPYAELAEMQGKTMALELAYGQELHADKSRVHELMVILLDNALKYTRENDSITVRTALRDGRALIEVADTGIGIAEDSRRRIFDRFYRADKARSREHGGSGLGLSIAKWIVDAHDGSISAQPREGGGTLLQVKFKK